MDTVSGAGGGGPPVSLQWEMFQALLSLYVPFCERRLQGYSANRTGHGHFLRNSFSEIAGRNCLRSYLTWLIATILHCFAALSERFKYIPNSNTTLGVDDNLQSQIFLHFHRRHVSVYVSSHLTTPYFFILSNMRAHVFAAFHPVRVVFLKICATGNNW